MALTTLLTVFALLTFTGLVSCSKSQWSAVPSDLTLYFTCDTNGRLEPCGCFSGQHGGLTRLKTHLNYATARDLILVDVGNAIEGPADYQIIKYDYIRKAYAQMRYSALNMGHREAQLPARELRKLKADSPVPMISANLIDKESGQPLFDPYEIVEYHGHKIAFIGVLAPPADPEALGDGLAVEPMETTLSKLLPQLKREADIFVLLAFADEAAMSKLAQEFYELDVILGGKVRQPSQSLVKENRSLILYTTNESKAVGVLKAELAGPDKLTPKNFDIVFLSEEIAQDRALLAQTQAYRDEIRHARLDVDKVGEQGDRQGNAVPGIAPAASYVGSEKCATCHASAYKTWENTGHHRAFAALAARGSDADPSCIACHTVGFGTPSGYQRAYAGKKLAGVGCESCHGPGSEHVRQHQSGKEVLFKYRPLGAADCVSCHYGEFSRPFDWETFWPKIKHGKEPKAPATTPATVTSTHPSEG